MRVDDNQPDERGYIKCMVCRGIGEYTTIAGEMRVCRECMGDLQDGHLPGTAKREVRGKFLKEFLKAHRIDADLDADESWLIDEVAKQQRRKNTFVEGKWLSKEETAALFGVPEGQVGTVLAKLREAYEEKKSGTTTGATSRKRGIYDASIRGSLMITCPTGEVHPLGCLHCDRVVGEPHHWGCRHLAPLSPKELSSKSISDNVDDNSSDAQGGGAAFGGAPPNPSTSASTAHPEIVMPSLARFSTVMPSLARAVVEEDAPQVNLMDFPRIPRTAIGISLGVRVVPIRAVWDILTVPGRLTDAVKNDVRISRLVSSSAHWTTIRRLRGLLSSSIPEIREKPRYRYGRVVGVDHMTGHVAAVHEGVIIHWPKEVLMTVPEDDVPPDIHPIDDNQLDDNQLDDNLTFDRATFKTRRLRGKWRP